MTDDLLARVAAAEAAQARRHPVKAAKRLTHYETILAARSAGEKRPGQPSEELEARAAAIRAGLAGVACHRCGRPLRDTAQPGYSAGIGPECYRKAQP